MLNRKDATQSLEADFVPKSFSIAAEVEDLNRYGKAFTGVMRDSTMVFELKNLFIKEGFSLLELHLWVLICVYLKTLFMVNLIFS